MTRTFALRGLALACLMALGTASTAGAATIPIIDIGNDADYSWTWAEDLTLGYEFTVTSSVTFNALAVFDVVSANPATAHTNLSGLNSSHEVGVWDSLGNLVVSTTVDPTDPTAPSANTYGHWVYQLITPTTLTAGNYTIGAFYGGSIENSDPVMVQQTAIENGAAVYVGGRYVYSSVFQQPTGNYAPNEEQYFGPTMLSVPDGGMTLTLLGGAMMGLVALRRRFKA
jgi:hypothetical protein